MTFSEHLSFDREPDLRGGTLVCAFRGWNDGGEAASTAATYLRDRWGAQRFARIDPEEFYDFQVARPIVRLEEGLTRHIEWPANEFYQAPGNPVGLFIGLEPNTRWRTFSEGVVQTARDLGVSKVVTLGAFLADVPHSLPSPVAGSVPDAAMAAELGVAPSRYEGPSGIVGVLHDAAHRAGVMSVSLWAAVPHYLPPGANPKAALALVTKLSTFLGFEVETDTLARSATAWEQQVAEVMEDNDELAAYVRRLEEGARESGEALEIPTGDALAAELERFLEERGEQS